MVTPQRPLYLFFTTLLLVALTPLFSLAQNEYLATLNYNTLAINRIANIPGMTYISIGTTYDPNNKRYFFLGSAVNGPPWSLYTINAVTGAIISNPLCPSGNAGGTIEGLQYDYGTNTLYGIWLQNGAPVSFVSINPANGTPNVISTLNNYQGYSQSTFDTKDHRYIVTSGADLLVIDAATGAIVYDQPAAVVPDMVYDNTTGKLYGINPEPGRPVEDFVSISLSTGTITPISFLPAMYIPQTGSVTIDEHNGKYVFVAGALLPSGCVMDSIYTLDVNTGAVLSRQRYIYGQGSAIGEENLLEFCFDNNTSTLYALNWFPPASQTLTPSITITASANPTCAGQPVVFTAQISNGGTTPTYQWQVNGKIAGTNDPKFTTPTLMDGDEVNCILSPADPCSMTGTAISNTIKTKVNSVGSAVTITASATTVCSADTTLFIAIPVNGGDSPSYEWLINDKTTNITTDTLMTTNLTDGDVISCILSSSLPCTLPVPSSNKFVMTVNPSPTINFAPDTIVIRPGTTITLAPVTTGDISEYQWTPVTNLDDPAKKSPMAVPTTTTAYQLTATGTDKCTVTARLTVLVYYELIMPNAFTPNNDGNNDVFRIPPSTPQKISSFAIFDRWGQQVFATGNSNTGWDGTFNGHPQPAGPYVWEITYQNLLSKASSVARGTVLLIR